MSKPSLHVVTDADAPLPPEPVGERIKRLQAEVWTLNIQQVAAMRDGVQEGLTLASDVIANPAQPEGIRQLAQRLVRDGESLLLTLDQISGRVS